MRSLDITTLETWLWDAACAIRGPVDAAKFKDYILPLVFLKRLSDVFDDEIAYLEIELGAQARLLVEQDHKLVRFYLPKAARWEAIRTHTLAGLGQYLTDVVRSIARENLRLAGVIDMVDFNATAAGQRIVPDDYLARLIEVLSRHRLGLADVEPDMLGRAYEYLLRKFAEDSGQSAGEFYTPREVAVLIAQLIEPQPGERIYDPCCGSGGLLIKCHLRLLETHGIERRGEKFFAPFTPTLPTHIQPLRLFGQEINPATFAMARMNAVIHDLEADIRIGDTMRQPAFKDAAGRLETFDAVVANPMWNQSFPAEQYEHDPFGRFALGIPPSSSADWGWLQHMLASLNDGGRMAVVLDTGAVSRGSGNQGSNRERDIRKAFVERDLIEAVILLPENLFYNTTAPGVIIIIRRGDPSGRPYDDPDRDHDPAGRPNKRRPGEILLINASKRFAKGRPKNYLTEDDIATIAQAYHEWRAGRGDAAHRPGFSTVITKEEAARNDYNLSPSRYVSTDGGEETLPLEEAMVLVREAEEERAATDARLREVLARLGLGGWSDKESYGRPAGSPQESYGRPAGSPQAATLPATDALPEGFKMTELGPLPADWQVVRLGEVINIYDKKRIPLNEFQRQSMKGQYPYCGANGIVDWINDYLFDGEYILLAEDGGYWGPGEQSSYIMRGKFWVNNHAHVLQAREGIAISYFVSAMLNFLDLLPYIGGDARGKLSQGVMKILPIPLPPLPEQQEIARILQTLDEKIAAEEKRRSALVALFKSLLAQLMSGRVRVSKAFVAQFEEGRPV